MLVRFEAKLLERKDLLDDVAASDPEKASAVIRAFALFKFEGRCALCGIEEWRTRRRLNLSRVIRERDSGLYTSDNVVMLCYRCQNHRRAWSLVQFEQHFACLQGQDFENVVQEWEAFERKKIRKEINCSLEKTFLQPTDDRELA
jgi:hypothetical protein